MNVGIEATNVPFLNKRSGNLHSHSSNGSTPKDLNPFDFTALSSKLPPNTGPPGTVPVSSNGSNSNKNLSHVPCKFYKQGICQAGSSCPFSHNLDGTLGADKLPCKYFQKGNCKFGLKCALAHFLPDGTRVNSKGYMNGGKKSNGNSSHSGNYNSNSSVSISSFQTQPIDIGNFNKNVNSPNKSANGNLGSNNNGSSQSSRVSQTINYTPTSSSMSLENNTQASFNSALNYSTSVYSHHAGSINVGSYGVTGTLTPSSNPVTTTTPRSAFASTNAFGSLSASTSPIGLTQDLSNSPQQSNFFSKNQPISYSPTNNLSLQISRSFSSKLPASHGSFSSYLNVFSESAIIDDEIKDTVDDGFFEEDYVPASLGDDILTPQQVQRRDSRSQSGTLLVRPIFKTRDSKFDNEYDEQKKSVFVQDDVFLME